MAPEIVRPDGGDAAPDPSREVEFALMLSRVIDSVEKNPEFLRATVYELARHKLKEEFTSESFGDIRNLSKSLETAIAGVEAFSKKKDGVSLLGSAEPVDGPRHHHVELAPAGILEHGIEARALVASLGTANAGVAVDLDNSPATPSRDSSSSSRTWFSTDWWSCSPGRRARRVSVLPSYQPPLASPHTWGFGRNKIKRDFVR